MEVDPSTRRIRLSLKPLQFDDERRDDGAPHGERPRPKRDEGERRQGRDRGPQMPTEEISMTIGDFLKSRNEDSGEGDTE
jgi:hypothetical protein